MWTVTFRRDWNDVQPRAEKRANKFAGCQVNVEREKLENLQLTWGLKKFLAGKGQSWGGRTVPGGLPGRGEPGTLPKGEKWNRMARRRRAEPLCATNAGANGRRAPRSPMQSTAISGKSCARIARGCGVFTKCPTMSWGAVYLRPGWCRLHS